MYEQYFQRKTNSGSEELELNAIKQFKDERASEI